MLQRGTTSRVRRSVIPRDALSRGRSRRLSKNERVVRREAAHTNTSRENSERCDRIDDCIREDLAGSLKQLKRLEV